VKADLICATKRSLCGVGAVRDVGFCWSSRRPPSLRERERQQEIVDARSS
jgi:hypothetical protein